MADIKIGKKETEDLLSEKEGSENAPKVETNPSVLAVDDNGSATAKLSEKTTVKMKGLNGLEAINITKLLPAQANPMLIMMYKAIASIREVNGVKYGMVKEQMEIDNLASRLTDREFDKLQEFYTMTFMLDEEQREKLKNL